MKMAIQDPNQHDGLKVVEMNRTKAIKERCYNCSGYSHKEVRNCEHTTCQLYDYRTGINKRRTADEKRKAIRHYCRDFCMDGSSDSVSNCTSLDCPLYPYRMSKIDKSVFIIDEENILPETVGQDADFFTSRPQQLNLPGFTMIENTTHGEKTTRPLF